jgi:hypothetical protein
LGIFAFGTQESRVQIAPSRPFYCETPIPKAKRIGIV